MSTNALLMVFEAVFVISEALIVRGEALICLYHIEHELGNCAFHIVHVLHDIAPGGL